MSNDSGGSKELGLSFNESWGQTKRELVLWNGFLHIDLLSGLLGGNQHLLGAEAGSGSVNGLKNRKNKLKK